MGRLVRRLVAGAHRASLRGATAAFAEAAADPVGAQTRRLAAILDGVRGSAYAREHGLGAARTLRELRERAPVADAESLAPWWRRIAEGEPDVLTTSPLRALEPSGGSSGATKLVPLTAAFLDEVAAATAPWMADLYAHHRALRGGSAYWAVSPPGTPTRRTPAGVRVGLDDDTEYLGPLARWGMRRLLAVPPEVARRADWRRETARRLVAAEDLSLVSVWSPTFLTLLLDEVERGLDSFLREAPASRAREVRARIARGASLGEALWPRLAVVSCWADGPSAMFLADLRARLPQARIQGKGLLATEGVVTLPLEGLAAPVAAVASHVLEFIEVERPDAPTRLPHELVVGRTYSPLLTTGAGLVRYHLKDAVTCVGRHRAAPLLRFEGRLDLASDLCGEKVSVGQAERALARLAETIGVTPRFALLAPSLTGRPHYVAYLEAEGLSRAALTAAADVIDACLAEAHPYRHCRQLGQLGPPRVAAVRDGLGAYERVLVEHGARAGAIKASALDARPRWDDVFEEVRA